MVEDAGILTDCSIKTQEPEDLLDFDFSGEDVANKIIMKVQYDIKSSLFSLLKVTAVRPVL